MAHDLVEIKDNHPTFKGAALPKHKRARNEAVEARRHRVYCLFKEGLTTREIAERMQISIATVHKDYHRYAPKVRAQMMEMAKHAALDEYSELLALRGAYRDAALNGDTQAAAVVSKVHDQVAKLLGLTDVLAQGLMMQTDDAIEGTAGVPSDKVKFSAVLVDLEADRFTEVTPPSLQWMASKSLSASEAAEYLEGQFFDRVPASVIREFRQAHPDHIVKQGAYSADGDGVKPVFEIGGIDTMDLLIAVTDRQGG